MSEIAILRKERNCRELSVFSIDIDREGLRRVTHISAPHRVAPPKRVESIRRASAPHCVAAPKRVAAPHSILGTNKDIGAPHRVAPPKSIGASECRAILDKVN